MTTKTSSRHVASDALRWRSIPQAQLPVLSLVEGHDSCSLPSHRVQGMCR